MASKEFLRRLVTLVLFSVGLAIIPAWGFSRALAVIAAGLLIYLFVPRAPAPKDALRYDRGPAVYAPDFLGIVFSGLLFAMPFWIGAADSDATGFAGLAISPAAFLVWPVALGFAVILWFSARYAAFWIVIEAQGLRVHRLGDKAPRLVAYDEITSVSPLRRGLPRWMKALTPLLVAAGQFTAAGSLMLARDTTGIILNLKDGTQVEIAADAFAKPLKSLTRALEGHGVHVPSVRAK